MLKRFFRWIVLLLLFAPANLALADWTKVDHLPLIDEGDQRALLLALDRQITHLESLPNKSYRFGRTSVTRRQLLATAKALRLVVLSHHGKPEFGLRVREKFDLFRAGNNAKAGKALFTGYYDPVINVSKTPDARFRFPLYKKPPDLRTNSGGNVFRVINGTMQPYFTRKQIDGDGVLRGKGLELAWAEDPVSVFYLQVQGSGLALYPDGSTANIHFAASNGHPFQSSARPCMNDGLCPGGYAENLAWFRAHPAKAQQYFFKNPRFIFFRLDDHGPVGVQGIPLTPYRTIAADLKHYPPGSLVFVKVPMPVKNSDGTTAVRPVGLIVAVGDTGNAIKGPGRADFYYGRGKQAGYTAGKTYGWGEMYFLLAK
jgi:peptidoglycan lytic transglycosylase A